MALAARTRRFSVEEYRMADAGILKPDDRVELIEGEIVEMAPIGPAHAVCVDRLNGALGAALRDRAVGRVQGPIALGRLSEPQPDVVVLQPPIDRYVSSHPGPGDILLLIEVADTSLELDRRRKISLYAAGGVQEVCVRTFVRGQALAAGAFSDVILTVDNILG